MHLPTVYGLVSLAHFHKARGAEQETPSARLTNAPSALTPPVDMRHLNRDARPSERCNDCFTLIGV